MAKLNISAGNCGRLTATRNPAESKTATTESPVMRRSIFRPWADARKVLLAAVFEQEPDGFSIR
jgi:hypothetical protein